MGTLYNDYNNDGLTNSTDQRIYEAFVEAQSIYSTPTPTIEQVQGVYNTMFVDAHRSPAATIVRMPDVAHSDFNGDGNVHEIDSTIYNAFIYAKILYRTQNPTLEQVQERYDTIFVAVKGYPATTVESLPNEIFD
jgi:hypothetical protein